MYRRCLTILKMGSEFGYDVLEKACEIALDHQTLNSPAVKKIIKQMAEERHQKPPIQHENIRELTITLQMKPTDAHSSNPFQT